LARERCFVPKRRSCSLLPRLFLADYFFSAEITGVVLGLPRHGLRLLDDSLSWAIRNMVSLGEPQFWLRKLKSAGELVPYGFMAWEKTWLYRVRDCYLVPWS